MCVIALVVIYQPFENVNYNTNTQRTHLSVSVSSASSWTFMSFFVFFSLPFKLSVFTTLSNLIYTQCGHRR